MRRHGMLFVAVVSAFALLAIGSVAEAQQTSLPHTGQGTNADGTCGSFQEPGEGDPVPGPGRQIWQFNLTQQGNPEDARMDATFNDGTVITGAAPDRTAGMVAMWFIETDLGAALESATAFFDQGQAGANPQFVVSHCIAGEEETTTTTTTVPKDTTTTTAPRETTTTTAPGETTTTTAPTAPTAPIAPQPPRAAPAVPVPAQPSFIG